MDMLSLIDDMPNHIISSQKLGKGIKYDGIERVLVCGMGGSAIAGDILKAYLSDEIEASVSKDYDIPLFVNEKTLAFIVSYSGNTEETIAAYKACKKRGAKSVALCSGGELEKLSKKDKTPLIKVLSGMPPRLATCYLFFPMLNVLQQSGLIESRENEINDTIKQLGHDYKRFAEEIAKRLTGKIPLIYSSSRYYPVAEKWKTDINENAKTHAFYNIFPEFNHNEINGFVNLNGNFYAVVIKDGHENPGIEKRMKIIKEIIHEKGVPVTEIKVNGRNYLSRLFSLLYLGLYVSYFLAKELKTDPMPVEIIEELKKRMKG